jgi:predicted dehydrogenase
MPHRLTRRRFLHEAAGLTAAATFAGALPAGDQKAPPSPPPSDRLNLGIIGVAGRGAENLKGVVDQSIVVLCDVDAERKGVREARKAYPRAKFYKDFRRVLDHKDVDAVVISTPDHMHAIPAVMAMRAGKHVYCEKPLAHSVQEIRVMMETAAKTGVVTQMGTQIHAQDNYRRVVELVQGGVIGEVRRVQVWCNKRPDPRHLAKAPVAVPAGLDYDLWLGPAPQRPYDPAFVPYHWRWFWDFGGGILADMACHYMDLPHWALGLRTPVTVAASGDKKVSPGDQPVPDLLQVDYHYPARGDQPAVHLTWYSGVPGPGLDTTKPFHGYGSGVLFEGSKGQLLADYTRHRLLPEDRFEGFTPPGPTIPASPGHHKEWIEACKGHGQTLCNFAYSGALAETVLLGNVAFRCGEKIKWDDRAGKADTPAAEPFLQREYRRGWKL